MRHEAISHLGHEVQFVAFVAADDERIEGITGRIAADHKLLALVQLVLDPGGGSSSWHVAAKYAPTGQIIWHTVKGRFATHSFALSELFSTADEAKAIAAKEAIAWANQRVANVSV